MVFFSGLGRAGHAAASAAVLAACSRLKLVRRAEALRAWRSGRRHRCGLAGGGGESEEDGGGRRGTGREVPMLSPDHSAACREERFSRLLSAACTATASRGAASGSPSLPPPHCQAPSFAVSSSLPAELRPRGGRPVISERHAKTRGAGGGRGDAAAGSRTLWAPRLEAGLILEPRLPPPLAGLEGRTKVRCRGSSGESSLPFSERARARTTFNRPGAASRCLECPRLLRNRRGNGGTMRPRWLTQAPQASWKCSGPNYQTLYLLLPTLDSHCFPTYFRSYGSPLCERESD